MWTYNKILQHPIKIKHTNPLLAKFIISQYGGPDGELAASLRYLSQRFGMPDQKSKAILNDIGTEELAHLEMVGSIVSQLTNGVPPSELARVGLGPYYTDHGWGVYPQAAAGFPFTAAVLAVKGDPIADLQEDLAAEQKARATYEKLIDLCADDPDVIEPLKFLREREIVHFQRFGEALRGVQDKLAEKRFFGMHHKPCITNNMGVADDNCPNAVGGVGNCMNNNPGTVGGVNNCMNNNPSTVAGTGNCMCNRPVYKKNGGKFNRNIEETSTTLEVEE